MKTQKKEPTRICDRCEHFEISPGGCVETCHEVRLRGTAAYNHQPYADERINGNIQNCKDFMKVSNRF